MEFITFSISMKIKMMKIRLALTAFCLFCIGIFSQAQDSKKAPAQTKPTVENGADAIPVTVTSTKKKAPPPPPPPPPSKKLQQKPPPPPPPSKKLQQKPPPPPPVEKHKD